MNTLLTKTEQVEHIRNEFNSEYFRIDSWSSSQSLAKYLRIGAMLRTGKVLYMTFGRRLPALNRSEHCANSRLGFVARSRNGGRQKHLCQSDEIEVGEGLNFCNHLRPKAVVFGPHEAEAHTVLAFVIARVSV